MAKQNTTPEFYAWDKYVTEARRADFVLKVSDDEELHITNPTGARLLRISQGLRNGDDHMVLLGITGDANNRVLELLGEAGHEALTSLLEDLMDHFGLYDEVELVGPGGGTVTASRPNRIKALLRAGYVPKD